jgi:hypothetical protein
MIVSIPSQRERVAGPGPGVGEVDVDLRRPLAEADAALEAALLVDGRIGREHLLQGCANLVAHGLSLWADV